MAMTYKTPEYNTMLFTGVYPDVGSFINDYKNLGIPPTISEESARTLYYLLIGKYANNPIANRDINQFKMKLFTVVYSHCPAWEKRIGIQKRLRELSEDEMLKGAKIIYNHAFNPSAEPTTLSTEELNYINDQNTNKSSKALLDAYGQLWDLISTDVTTLMLSKFEICFKKVVAPERPLLYYEEEE